MQLLKETKAVSTIVLIILMLCSAILGALISYMFVIANFYLEPENTVDLVITEVDFPVDHADYFDLTVMNPSHSSSGTSIAEIYFTAVGEEDIHYVTTTDLGELPISLERGTSKKIRCFENWGQYAGKTIMVYVSATNASGAVCSVETEFVELEVQTYFNATESCKYFNVTVINNGQSAINLTLTNVYFDYEPVENMTIELPRNMPKGETIEFQCLVDWEGHAKPLVRVVTDEGYTAEIRKEVSSLVILSVTNVKFNETDPNKLSISFFNSPDSATPVNITDIVLTCDNGTEYHINGSLANPSFFPYYRLEKNKTVTFDCVWHWRNYRDKNLTIIAYTKQGFRSTSKTVIAPQPVIFKITELTFNLTNTGFFSVNVTNMPCSLQSINVTQIKFNENATEATPPYGKILAGGERQFSCAFDWTGFRGENANVTVCTAEGLNISKSLMIPSIELRIIDATFKTLADGKLFKVTVENVKESLLNVTITRIVVIFENETVYLSEGIGFLIEVGKNMTLTFSWDWNLYENEEATISVYTQEGFEAVAKFSVEEYFSP